MSDQTLAMLYGPWQVRFTKSDPARRNRLVIKGSDTHDNVYERTFGGDDIALEVTGAAWSIEIESSPANTEDWRLCELQRDTRYEPPDGVTVIIRGRIADEQFEELRVENVVRCVYRDPELNPPPSPDPFDFTYGGD